MIDLGQTHFMALLAIMILAFILWLRGGLPTQVAGFLVGLALYTFIRLFPAKRGKS